ncbi:hypothetical protein E2I00_016097, partial [Balaenoptera physalus]
MESCHLSRTTLGQFSQSLDVLCALWFQFLKVFFKRRVCCSWTGPSVAEERKFSTQHPKKHLPLEAAKVRSSRRPVEQAHAWPLPGLDNLHPFTLLASCTGHGRCAWFPIHSRLEERRGVLLH